MENINPSGHGSWVHDHIRLHYSAAPNQFWGKLTGWPERGLEPYMFMVSHHPLTKGMFDPHRMKPIFTVRNLFDQLESWLIHAGYDHGSQNQFVRSGYVEQAIQYLNYWSDFISDTRRISGRDYLCIRYEEMILNPIADLARIRDFWQLAIGESSLEQAIELCDRGKMVKKVAGRPNNKRITIDEKRDSIFSNSNVEFIRHAITNQLKESFGYDYHDTSAD